MRAMSEIVGLPVIVDGDCIGHVLCAEPDELLRQINAVWMTSGRMGSRRIDRTQIRQIGDIAVHAHSKGEKGSPAASRIFHRAVSTDGSRIGAAVDADFDDSMDICALWLTHGYPDDLLTGRRRITRYSVRPSDGCVLVPSGEEEEP